MRRPSARLEPLRGSLAGFSGGRGARGAGWCGKSALRAPESVSGASVGLSGWARGSEGRSEALGRRFDRPAGSLLSAPGFEGLGGVYGLGSGVLGIGLGGQRSGVSEPEAEMRTVGHGAGVPVAASGDAETWAGVHAAGWCDGGVQGTRG